MISLFNSFILKALNKYFNFVLLILFIIYKGDRCSNSVSGGREYLYGHIEVYTRLKIY